MNLKSPHLRPERRALHLVAGLVAAFLAACSDTPPASAPGQTSDTPASTGAVNLYTTREPALIQPLLDAFSAESGVTVNTVLLSDGLEERVRSEAARSPADLLMTVDGGRLLDLVSAGLTQPVRSDVLEAAIPAHLRDPDGHWHALSLRDRVVYADKGLDIGPLTYEALAGPEWKGRVCMRSGQHPYNISLIAAMIAHQGEAKTADWLRGIKANLARPATGGDRDVARDILAGICDIGIANAYYVGRMKSAEPGSEQHAWGEAIQVIRPVFASAPDGGTHVNMTGAAVARYAPNRDNAVRLLEYLVSDQAQSLYARANYEYPVKPGVELDPIVASLGELKADPLPPTEIARFRTAASRLVDSVGFDN